MAYSLETQQPNIPEIQLEEVAQRLEDLLSSETSSIEIPEDIREIFERNFVDYNSRTGIPNPLIRTSEAVSILDQIKRHRDTSLSKLAIDILNSIDNDTKKRAGNLINLAQTVWGANLTPELEESILRHTASYPSKSTEITPNLYIDEAVTYLTSLEENLEAEKITLPEALQQINSDLLNSKEGRIALLLRFLDLLYIFQLAHYEYKNEGQYHESQTQLERPLKAIRTLYIPLFEILGMQNELHHLKAEAFRWDSQENYDLFIWAQSQQDNLARTLERDKTIAFRLIYELIKFATKTTSPIIPRRDALYPDTNDTEQYTSQYYNRLYLEQNKVIVFGRNKSIASGLEKAVRYCGGSKRSNRCVKNMFLKIPDRLGLTIILSPKAKQRLLELLQYLERTGRNQYTHPAGDTLEILTRKSGYNSIHWTIQVGSRPIEIHIETPEEHFTNHYIATHATYKLQHEPGIDIGQFYILEASLREKGKQIKKELLQI